MNEEVPKIPRDTPKHSKQKPLAFSLVRWFARLIKFSVFVMILLVVMSLGFVLDYFYSKGPLQEQATTVIASGTPLRDVSEQLADQNIIAFPDIFTSVIRFMGSGKQQVKAGEYAFVPGVTPLEVFDILRSGNVVVHHITVAEGLTVTQVTQMLEKIDILTGDVPPELPEGSLLPETYDYYYGETRQIILNRMKQAMDKTLDELWNKRKANLLLVNKEEALTLASIVEKETGVASERGRVAAVFINRLQKKMRLQTDPTVIYAITDGKFVLDRPLTRLDLKVDSPYNTYTHAGLPPHPIANPGRASLEAVMNPPDTIEYYFVADGTGGHQFAQTLKEHLQNINAWKKVKK